MDDPVGSTATEPRLREFAMADYPAVEALWRRAGLWMRPSDETEQVGVAKAVENVTSFPPVGYYPGLAQSHQVLGKGGLAQAEHGFQMADTGFT